MMAILYVPSPIWVTAGSPVSVQPPNKAAAKTTAKIGTLFSVSQHPSPSAFLEIPSVFEALSPGVRQRQLAHILQELFSNHANFVYYTRSPTFFDKRVK